jgi:nickel-type superoxide dismutase maturation protease
MGALTAVGLARRWFRRVRITGDSMLPAFQPGDRLLVGPPAWIRPGAVVAVEDPRSPGRLMVKRVHAVDRSGVDVRGDNVQASTDSRQFGPVPRGRLVGRIVYRYGPPGRTGWWPGRMSRAG